MPFLFQNLRVYQQAIALADEIATFTGAFPRSSWHVGDQLNRASLSVALNIAESTGRGSDSDKRRFLVMARGSVHECAALFDMCERRKLIPDVRRAELAEQLTTISKMLSGMMDRYRSGDGVREDGEEYTP